MENRVYQIIEEEFDNRLGLSVILFLLDNGTTRIKNASLNKYLCECTSEKDIDYKLIKCAKRIANECTNREILQYVTEEWGWSLERR